MKSKWGQRGLKTLRAVVLVYFGLAFLVHFFPNGLIFFPSREGDWTVPRDAEEVFFTARDGTRLHGWWREVNPDAGTFIVLHGNAGNITTRKHLIKDLGDLAANVLLFDYRGFGKSEGSPTEDGVNLDAEAAWDFVVKEKGIKPSRIVLYGQSLGSAFACHLALARECQGVILEAPFSSARDMAGVLLPWVPLGWALGVDMDNVSRVRKLKVPLLVLQGDRDSVIPNELGKAVFDAARVPKRLALLPGGGHNDIWQTCTFGCAASLDEFFTLLGEGAKDPPSPRSSLASRP